MSAQTDAPETITVSAGDVRLAARRWIGSDRRPVLLVHGLSSNARLWDTVGADLAAVGHPVLAVDLRGHGRSAGVDSIGDDPTLTAAADLAKVCTAVGWPDPVVAGQSWGGNVVLQLAADHPELVHGVGLIDGGWLHLGDRWTSLDAAWDTLAPPRLAGLEAETLRTRLAIAHPDWSTAAVDATLANLERLPDGTVRPWLSRERHRQIVASMLRHRPRELYPLVRCRCVLMTAGASNGDAKQALAALPAGSRLLPFPDADHDLHAQHPHQVATAIEDLT